MTVTRLLTAVDMSPADEHGLHVRFRRLLALLFADVAAVGGFLGRSVHGQEAHEARRQATPEEFAQRVHGPRAYASASAL